MKHVHTVHCSYTGLGYTGILTNQTGDLSPQKNLTAHVLYSPVFGYTGFLAYRTEILGPSQSGMKAIDCILCSTYMDRH